MICELFQARQKWFWKFWIEINTKFEYLHMDQTSYDITCPCKYLLVSMGDVGATVLKVWVLK